MTRRRPVCSRSRRAAPSPPPPPTSHSPPTTTTTVVAYTPPPARPTACFTTQRKMAAPPMCIKCRMRGNSKFMHRNTQRNSISAFLIAILAIHIFKRHRPSAINIIINNINNNNIDVIVSLVVRFFKSAASSQG